MECQPKERERERERERKQKMKETKIFTTHSFEGEKKKIERYIEIAKYKLKKTKGDKRNKKKKIKRDKQYIFT